MFVIHIMISMMFKDLILICKRLIQCYDICFELKTMRFCFLNYDWNHIVHWFLGKKLIFNFFCHSLSPSHYFSKFAYNSFGIVHISFDFWVTKKETQFWKQFLETFQYRHTLFLAVNQHWHTLFLAVNCKLRHFSD